MRPDTRPTYRWADLYIAQPVGAAALPAQPSSPQSDSGKSRYIVIPGWSLTTLRAQGFNFASATDPHLPRLITRPSTRDPLFIFTHSEKGIQIRIHTGWCDRDKGLWATVEFVDLSSYVAVLAERTHTDQVPGATCILRHVKDWNRTSMAVSPKRTSFSPPPDRTKLRWTRSHEFTALGRTVNLSLVDPGPNKVDDTDDSRDELWVLGIEAVFPWSTQPIPTSNPPPLSQEPQLIALRRPSLGSQQQGNFKCTFPQKYPYRPRSVDASQGQMFVFQSPRRHEEVRVHVGWCNHDRGLWACVEFVDTTTNGAKCAEPVHDDTTNPPETRLAGCPFVHVKDWACVPQSSKDVPPDSDQAGITNGSTRLVRTREFSVLERTMRLRISREPSPDPTKTAAMVGDDSWVLEVELPSRWKANVPPIPPPRPAHDGLTHTAHNDLMPTYVEKPAPPLPSSVRVRLLWERLTGSLRLSRT